MGAALMPVLAIASMAGQLGSSIYGMSQQKSEASKARRQQRAMEAANRKYWEQHAYRSPEQIEALRKQGSAEIESARAAGQERLMQAVGPARGWGRGSGVMGAAMGELEASKLKDIASLETKMTELATTPMWAYSPYGGYGGVYGATSTGGNMAGGISDSLSQAAGYINTMYGTGGNNMVSSGNDPYANLYSGMGSWGMYG